MSAIIAETKPRPIADFSLTPSEDAFFRARAIRTLNEVGRKTSAFKSYYALRMQRPFLRVILITAAVIVTSVVAASYFYLASKEAPVLAPLFAACAAATFAAVGWGVAGWISHRNAVRQTTTNILFARFSQATFCEAMHRFHARFGYRQTDPITPAMLETARGEGEDAAKAAESVTYLLNYFEFIAAGVMSGDLDAQIIRDNIRGFVVYYYDRCEPHIFAASRRNPRAYEFLRKLRTHYREP